MAEIEEVKEKEIERKYVELMRKGRIVGWLRFMQWRLARLTLRFRIWMGKGFLTKQERQEVRDLARNMLKLHKSLKNSDRID